MAGETLTVTGGPDAGKTVAVGEVVALGRHAGNDLVLTDPAASRRHARLVRRGAGLFLEDLGSAHGTRVNGELIKSRELRPGDLVELGGTTLRFVGPVGSEAPAGASDVLLVENTTARRQSSIPLVRSGSDPQAQAQRFEALLRVGLAFQGEPDTAKLFTAIAQALLDTLAVDRCGIFLRGKTSPELVLSKTGLEPAAELPFSRTLLARAFDAGEALVTADAGRDSRLQGASLAAGTIRAAMVAPLWGRERVVGAVVVENRRQAGAFTAGDLRLLVFLANLAGTAIENAHLIAEVRRETEERAALARFFSPAVADKIRRQGLSESLKGERCEITALFTDIRGFTSLSETLPPEELIEALNRAFACMSEAIFAEQGMIDKFTGDGLLALFGTPIRQPDHAARAVRAARALLQSCAGLTTTSGRPLPVGVGLATGTATVGTVGSVRRLEYTAIGDVVNVAARLVAQAPGGAVLMPLATVTAAGVEAEVESIGRRQLKGKSGDLEVFKILGTKFGDGGSVIQ